MIDNIYSFENLDKAITEWRSNSKRSKYHPKNTLKKIAEDNRRFLNKSFPDIKILWTKVNTFGYVFFTFDFQKGKNRNIVNGEKYLADFIKNDTEFKDCIVVLSESLENSYKVEEIENNKILLIGINEFNNFYKRWKNRDTINFFFFRISRPEEKSLFDVMIRRNYNYIMEQNKSMIINSLQNEGFEINNKSQLVSVPNLLKNAEINIKNNIVNYKKILKEFYDKIYSDITELKINEWLLKEENIWILGLEYLAVAEEHRGKNDIRLRKIDSEDLLIIELKRPNAKTSVNYSTHEVLSANVHKGISQAIDYLCEESKKGVMAKAIVVIGRKKNEIEGIDNKAVIRKIEDMNYFLHNIELTTFEHLYERALIRLNFIETGKVKRLKKEVVEEICENQKELQKS